jgi:hypothetical protein
MGATGGGSMDTRRKLAIGAAAAFAALAIGGGVGIAAVADDDEPLRGDELRRATAAALEHTGGGTVVETEAGDDGAAFSVEVRLGDGSVVEVNLDEGFAVIGSEADDDAPGEDED